MPRKRSRRGGSNAAPFFIVAFIIGALVVWAVYPRHHAHRVPTHRAIAVVTASPLPATQAAASPVATQEATAVPTAPSSPAGSPAAAVSPPPGGAQVAIIIDDCGQWLDTEQQIIALPIPITLSVLPHVRYTERIAQEAADAGKGVMLHIPMEPISHVYPGPGEIKDAMTDDQVTKQTEDDVAQVPLAKGANNHEGSEASADDRVMKDVIGVLKAHDLFFVDSRTSAQSVGQAVAQDEGVPNSKRDVFLDNQADVAYTESMLQRAVDVARRNGSAIAIGHPKPTTLAAIRDFYPKMQAQGVTFVLAQSLVH